jgi:hypothetical protein
VGEPLMAARKYQKFTIVSPQGRKLVVIKAKKLKWARVPKTPIGFRPICSHGVEL